MNAALWCALSVFGLALSAAAVPQELVRVSPDTAADFGVASYDDADAAFPSLPFASLDLGPIPDKADVNAVAELANGDRLISFDMAIELPAGSGFYVEAGDVVRFDGTSYTLEFDASAHGVPNGAAVDAVGDLDGELLLSFDISVELPPGSGNAVEDEDLIAFDGAAFVLPSYFDGSANGVAATLDLDAVHAFGDELVVSFDCSGEVGGVAFDDEDLLGFLPASGTWNLAFDAGSVQPALAAADVDAVSLPEPGSSLLLACGAGFLALLGRRRAQR